jgi:DNA-binding response OmpR family regulator
MAATAGWIRLLVISPLEEDRESLREMLRGSNTSVRAANNFAQAKSALRKDRYDLIICEQELPDANWKDILNYVRRLQDIPRLTVTSSDADDQLWAEVLNLGGFEVLHKPFYADEVTRMLQTAALRTVGAWAR